MRKTVLQHVTTTLTNNGFTCSQERLGSVFPSIEVAMQQSGIGDVYGITDCLKQNGYEDFEKCCSLVTTSDGSKVMPCVCLQHDSGYVVNILVDPDQYINVSILTNEEYEDAKNGVY